MAYTQEPTRFAEQIAAARDIAGGSAVWAGIGAYRLTAGADDREHPGRKTSWHRRLRPLLVRQPHRPRSRRRPTISTSSVAELCRGNPASHHGGGDPALRPLAFSTPARLLAIRDCRARVSRGRRRSRPTERGALAEGVRHGSTYRPTPPATTDETVFDLASLTKVIATATLTMRAIDTGSAGPRRSRGEPATGVARRRSRERHDRDLLAHASGLTAYLPFFRDHHGRAGVRAQHLHPAARVRAAHAVDLQRSRVHAPRLHARRRRERLATMQLERLWDTVGAG